MARVSGKSDAGTVLEPLGAAIRASRKKVGLSQEALADAAGIDRSHMGKIERGERNVTLLNLCRIADALRTKVSALLLQADL
jgi:transcriptional regulator with XRE-family HTH domain